MKQDHNINEYLGGRPLFIDMFIPGTRLPPLSCSPAIDYCNWLEFKKEEVKERFFDIRLRWTQSVSYLHEIDLSNVELILEDLWHIYKSFYVYANKTEFAEHYLLVSIGMLKDILENNLNFYYDQPEGDWEYYFYYDTPPHKELIDVAIKKGKGLSYYLQYLRRLLELIDSFLGRDSGSLTLANDLEEEKSDIEITKPRITAITEVLAFILDCKASDQKPPYSNEKTKKIIPAQEKRLEQGVGICAPITFYKNYKTIDPDSITITKVEELIGEDWEEKLLACSIDSQKLKPFLISLKSK